MRIAVIIPDRNDRPRFLANCLRILKSQTVQPDHIEIVNYPAKDNKCDITPRYRAGYEACNAIGGFDFYLFIENDDFYAPNYIEVMRDAWLANNKPDLLGTDFTTYYNIRINWHFTMHHMERSSAMSTLIKPNLRILWPVDEDPYLDAHIWRLSTAHDGNGFFRGVIFKPTAIICIGIKHGDGMCGGGSHDTYLDRYYNHGTQDERGEWLAANVDKESFNFYWNYFK